MELIPTNTFLEFLIVTNMEMHYAVFVKLNGSIDNTKKFRTIRKKT